MRHGLYASTDTKQNKKNKGSVCRYVTMQASLYVQAIMFHVLSKLQTTERIREGSLSSYRNVWKVKTIAFKSRKDIKSDDTLQLRTRNIVLNIMRNKSSNLIY